jgi:hypothetical protein
VEALHKEGIRAPIYISVQCDEYAANTHPEWVARNPDTTQVKWGMNVFQPGWQIMDMSSPYLEFLEEQTAEILKLFKPVDGLFFDMCWDQPSTTKWAIAGMKKAGLNPENEADRKTYSRQVSLGYMQRLYDLTKSANKDATVFFNSRPLFNLAEEVKYQAQVEIEALPTGGWGYLYFPKNVRFARTFGKPYLGMTARFHKSWADFGGLKPYAALEYETSQMMAHGAACSIGDQLHPRGILDKAAYELIGKVYARVEQREPWLNDAKPLSQIGLFQVPAGVASAQATSGTDEGATRLLTQLKHQFDVVNEFSKFEQYDLLILPDSIRIDDALLKRLRSYVKKGGALLASGTSGLSVDGVKVLLPELNIDAHGLSPFTTTYVRFGQEIAEGIPDSDHVMYEKSVRATAARGATTLARIVEPYFERTWDHFSSHNQTPGDKLSKYAAAVVSGQAGYISYPIFSAFANHGNLACRWLVERVIERLLPDPLLRVTAPSSTEATVAVQGNRHIVHLLQYCPERRTQTLDIVEDIVPLYDVPVSLKLERKPSKVYSAPENEKIDFTWQDGRANIVVPKVNGHAMIVFE